MKLGVLIVVMTVTASAVARPQDKRGLFDWIIGDESSTTDGATNTATTTQGFLNNLFGGNDKTSGSEESSAATSQSEDLSQTTASQSDAQPNSESLLFSAGDISLEQSNGYQPYFTQCPSHDIVRKADGISNQEKDYIQNRHAKTNPKLIQFLKSANIDDAESIVNDAAKDRNISIGLSFSGGGYRAMLAGAGQLLALDDSFDDSNSKGLGGILQSSSYLVGLSGGNWLVGTVVLNNGLSVGDIWSGKNTIWNLEQTIFNQGGWNIIEIVKYYTRIGESLDAKDEAGFKTSITDVWGRGLSNQFFPDDTRGGENVTWSSIRNLSNFESHDMPFPIVIADGRTPGLLIISENSTVFEFTPYELGSWDPSLGTMIDIQYLGTEVFNGKPKSNDKCVLGFDNGGYVMGTLSSLFNQALVKTLQLNLPLVIKTVISKILDKLSLDEVDIANYYPNPFYQVEGNNSKSIVSNDTLSLVDGGEDWQNVPFYPLIQQHRQVDVIFAFDNSADTDNWPNGTSVGRTYQRQFSPQGKGSPFPYSPTVNSFLNDGLLTRPIFLGCDASALQDLVEYHEIENYNATDIPLVIHMPSLDYTGNANTLTFKMYYNSKEKYQLMENGFSVSTRGNLTDDKNWKTCVGCAVIRRSQERQGVDISDECRKCFQQYCWNGTAVDSVYDDNFAEYLKKKGKEAPEESDFEALNRTNSGGIGFDGTSGSSSTTAGGESSNTGSSGFGSSGSSGSSAKPSSSKTNSGALRMGFSWAVLLASLLL